MIGLNLTTYVEIRASKIRFIATKGQKLQGFKLAKFHEFVIS